MTAPRVTLAMLWAQRLPWLMRSLAGLRSGGGHVTGPIFKRLPVNRGSQRRQRRDGRKGRQAR